MKSAFSYVSKITVGITCVGIREIVANELRNMRARDARNCAVFDAGRLMNRLLKAAEMPTILYRTKAPSSFVALSNIESFVAAAKAFGVPETSLFQPSDLVDGRKGPLLYVLNCINQLGLIVRIYHFIVATK